MSWFFSECCPGEHSDTRVFLPDSLNTARMLWGDARLAAPSILPNPGYRCAHPGYARYTRRGKAVVILLCGDDKRTQSKDIRRAKDIAETLED
jgi:hypothetical protein